MSIFLLFWYKCYHYFFFLPVYLMRPCQLTHQYHSSTRLLSQIYSGNNSTGQWLVYNIHFTSLFGFNNNLSLLMRLQLSVSVIIQEQMCKFYQTCNCLGIGYPNKCVGLGLLWWPSSCLCYRDSIWSLCLRIRIIWQF